MDLMSVDVVKAALEGSEMKVLHPVSNDPMLNDDKTPMTITLMGADSEAYRRTQRLAINRRIKQGRRGNATAEELESDALELLATVTVKWNITVGGEKPECTKDTAREIYQKIPWLREQVDQFVGDRANFLKGPVTSS